MLGEIFTSQRQFINYFFDHVDVKEAENVLAQFLACKGMIVFTGIGKSGIIAEKLAKTLISLGTRSVYLPPSNALHGDIGLLSSDDLVVILSKSGKSREVLEFASIVKRRKIAMMSWVSEANAPLAKISDFTVHLPIEREICPFDLAPTTSTAVQLIFGDVIGVALMRAKQFSLDQYALNHPGGAIGKLIAERVEDIMVQGADLPLCKGEDTLQETLVELSAKRLGCVLVVDEEGHLEGIFTDGDLRRALERQGGKVLTEKMCNLMTKSFTYVSPDVLTSKAVAIMEQKDKRIMMLPVLQGDKVIGLVHLHDILSTNITVPNV